MKKVYIAQGLDQQGRRATGVWTTEDLGRAWRSPHRTGADFVDTYPTGPAPLEAHGCWEPEDDKPHTAHDGWIGALLMLASALGAVAGCWALVRWLA